MTEPGGASYDIMGVCVMAARADAMIADLQARLTRGERVKLAFLNAHGSNIAAGSAAFRSALEEFTVLNDGVGVDIAARMLYGSRFPDNLNGTDFVPRFISQTASPQRIYLIGGLPGVAATAGQRLKSLAPQHVIVGTRDGYFSDAETPSVVAGIAAAQPDIVLVAMGNPAQELFIARHFDAMDCCLAIGVGALFDFLAGRAVRAPRLVRRMRLEWGYRLLREPGRLWRRYILGNSQFLCRLMYVRLTRAGTR